MTEVEEQYEPCYLQGIRFFNDCDFFEAHEIWEELWTDHRGPARKFYQGLIQAAVALHHFGNGNMHGARKVYYSSCNYLNEYRPYYIGLDLEAFLAQYRNCFAEILATEKDPSQISHPPIAIDPDRIPEIHLDPAPP